VDFAPALNTEILELLHWNTIEIPVEKALQWAGGTISTFSYLMSLNVASGRTFDSVSMYPVLPNIFSHSQSQGSPPPSLIQSDVMLFEEFESYDLPSDFFFQPEAVEGGLDRVYRNRKLLERAQNLHRWIDAVFGGLSPHPPRSRLAETIPTEVVHQTILNGRLLGVTGIGDEEFWILDSAGQVTSFRIDGTIRIDCVELTGEPAVSALEHGFLICDEKSGRVTIFTNTARFDVEGIEFDYIISSGTQFCVVRNRSVITLNDIHQFPDPIATVAVTQDIIEATVMSTTLYLLCTATRDNVPHFHSLRETVSVKKLLITLSAPSCPFSY
jgi:hypothetical protein